MNWEEACQTLGVPVTAAPAEIRDQYVYKAQLLHPDKTSGLPELSRQKAEEELKLVNAAYAILKDPKNNTIATPPKLRVYPRSIRFTEVGPGQPKTTRIHIENVGGPYTKFWMADSPVPWLRIAEARSMTSEPLPLEVTVEATASGTAQKRWQCDLPVRIENEKTSTRDEVAVRIEMRESARVPVAARAAAPETETPYSGEKKSVFPELVKILFLALAPPIAGVLIYAYIQAVIPFCVLSVFSATYLIEKWFGYPVRKHRTVGIFYRVLLNLGILSYLGFMTWSGFQLYSRQFMATPLEGSLVFLLECIFLIWLLIVVVRNSWRLPSMKLTVATLAAAFVVFSYAGVQPMATYKDIGISHLSSFFNKLTTQGTTTSPSGGGLSPLQPGNTAVAAPDGAHIRVTLTDSCNNPASF